MSYFIRVGNGLSREPEYWSKNGSNLYFNSANVGLGVPNPNSVLSIDGNASIGDYLYSLATAPPNGLLIQGNVGIGTVAPDRKLHIVGNTKVDGDLLITGAVQGSGLTQWTTVNTNEVYYIGNVGIGTNDPTARLDVKGDGIVSGNLTVLGQVIASGLSQWSNASTGSISYLGNVGIGVSNPTSKLHISGNTRIEGDLTVNGTQTIINTNVGTTERLVITNDGTGPALEVNQLGAQPVVDFQDDGVSAFKIINGGTVGIGTTNPNSAYKLHVMGDILASGSVFRQFIGCSVRTSQSITSGSSTTLIYTTIDVNSGGYSSSTGIFTCPSAGYYFITAQTLNQATGANRLKLFRDATQISPDGYTLGNEYASVSASAITYCAAGNTLLSKALYAQGLYSSMTIYLIG